MPIPERLQLLEDRMRLHCDREPKQLEQEILRITRLNAAKGKLKSGQTLIDVRRAAESLIDKRSARYCEVFEELNISHNHELEEPIATQIEGFFSSDLPLLKPHLDKLYKLVGNERAATQVHRELLEHLESSKQNLLLSIRTRLDVDSETRAPANQPSEDIVDVKPNFMGIGMNLNALWRRIRNITRRST